MPLALLTLGIEDSDGDNGWVWVHIEAGTGDTVASLSADYLEVFWDAVRPFVNGVLVSASVSFEADISAWSNNTLAAISDVEEKAIIHLRVCGGSRPVRFTLPTVKESVFENSGAGKLVDATTSDFAVLEYVLANGVVDDGIGATDSHGNDICGILFGEQSFGKG